MIAGGGTGGHISPGIAIADALERSAPDAEVFFILGEEDKIVASEVERQTFETLCGQGYKMEFMECAGKGHTDAALYSFSLQLDWALNCLDGEGIPPEDLCALKDPGECALW